MGLGGGGPERVARGLAFLVGVELRERCRLRCPRDRVLFCDTLVPFDRCARTPEREPGRDPPRDDVRMRERQPGLSSLPPLDALDVRGVEPVGGREPVEAVPGRD